MKLPLLSATPMLVPQSHEAPLAHSPPSEAARGGNRSICHSLQDRRVSQSPWRRAHYPMTLGDSGILAGARHALRNAGGPVPAHQAQRVPLSEAALDLQLQHLCKPQPISSLTHKLTHASNSLTACRELGSQREGSCMV